MATSKPQFNVYLDPTIREEIEAHVTRTGVPKGKLVESMWRFFNLRDIPMLVDRMAVYITKGVPDKDLPHLHKLMIAIKKGLDERLEGDTNGN